MSGRRRTAAEEASRELEFHIAMKTEELVAAGRDRESARREAEARFGDLGRVRDECAAIDERELRLRRIRSMLRGAMDDVRYGARVLLRRPGFSLVAVFTLALGIGANTAIFSVVNAVLVRPLPYESPERLVMLWESHPQRSNRSLVTPGNFMDWRDELRGIPELAAYRNDASVALTGGGQPVEVAVAQVTPNLFALLGVRPVSGRLFDVPSTLPEGIPGTVQGRPAEAVALISHSLWRTRFGADAGMVGRTIELAGESLEVIGVLPPDVAIPSNRTQVWVPMGLTEGARQQRRTHMYAVLGRLGPDETVAGAQAELTSLAARIGQAHPENMEGWTARVTSFRADMVRDARSPLLLLLGAVGVVLLIACVNVSNLLFARGIGREREVAVRAALGARRGGLIRQFLAESLVLAACGGMLAFVVAWPATRILVRMAPSGIPLVEGTRIDGTVLGFGTMIVLATTLVFGILPALRASRPRVERALADSRSRGGNRRHGRLRRGLVVVEVALAMVLVTGAALLARSMAKLRSTDTGYTDQPLLIASLYPSLGNYNTSEEQLAFYDALLDRLRAEPGILSVAGTSEPPVVGYAMTFSIRVEDRPDAFAGGRNDHYVRAVTDDWFGTVGLEVRAGREFDARDRANGRAVAIVNEAMARLVAPGENAIGRRIRTSDEGPWEEIIGVVANARHWGPGETEGPVVYIPYSQKSWAWMSWMTLAIRTSGEPTAMVPALQRAVWSIDADLPIQRASTLDDLFGESISNRRFTTTLLGIFAMLALVLGVIGLYGVIAFGVAERHREIGVRLALGETPGSIVSRVLGEGIGLAFSGIATGLGAALMLRGTLNGLLFETSPFDPAMLAVAGTALMVAAGLACIVPALRAVRVDPATTLRSD